MGMTAGTTIGSDAAAPGAAGTVLAPAANVAAAPAATGTNANYLSTLTGDQTAAAQQGAFGGTMLDSGQKLIAYNGAQVGEGGITGSTGTDGYVAFAPNAKKGDMQGLYNAQGQFTGESKITGGGQIDWGDVLKGAATIGAFALGANALFGGIGGATGGVGETAASSTAGGTGISTTPAGYTNFGVVDDSVMYTPGPTNYALDPATQAGISVNPDGTYLRTGEDGLGLQFNDTPNVASMGGGQGLTVQGGQTLGDPASFINAPEYQLPGAEQTTVAEGGAFNDYQPDLGDPNSPINGGSNPWPNVPVTPDVPFDWGSLFDGVKGGAGIASVLGSILGAGKGNGGTAMFPIYQGNGIGGTAAGGFGSNSASGGASGSLQGVAGTLLTMKSGGKTMLA